MVRKSTSAARRSSITASTSSSLSPEPQHDAGLGEELWVERLGAGEQGQRLRIARAGSDAPVERWHRLDIVVEHVGPRREHDFQCAVFPQEIRRQDLDTGMRRGCADGCDGRSEMRGAAVFKIVAIDRGHDDMVEAERRHGGPHPRRLGGIEMVGTPGLDVAEGASPGAGVAHDHDGGVPLRPALADIGTGGLRADGVETVFAEDCVCCVESPGIRRPDAKPGRLRKARRGGASWLRLRACYAFELDWQKSAALTRCRGSAARSKAPRSRRSRRRSGYRASRRTRS